MSVASTDQPKLQKSRIRHTRVFLWLLFPLLIMGHGLFGYEGWIDLAMETVGYALVIMCVLGRGYCALFIGGRKNDELVMQGPFSVCRNPLYFFSFLGVVGIGMQSDMLLLLGLLVVGFAFYYRIVIRKEEAFLSHKFGEAYATYKARVPVFLPKMSLWVEPESINTQPKFVRRTLTDAVAFFLPMPIFEMLEMLNEKGILEKSLQLF